MFWLDNLNILTIPLLIPDINMTFEEKLNSIIRALLFLITNSFILLPLFF